ncbi:MAG: hypothetical protein JNL39_09445 [Opitutaceae bacterium]|nr:hypothetical protein [Opitutaceae bacterium]
MPPVRITLLVSLLVLCSGCAFGGRASRIEQHAAKFAALPAGVQRHVRSGNIDYGFDQDTVFMAIGGPSRVTPLAEPEGAFTWSYRNFVFGTAPAAALTMAAPGGFADPSRVAGPGTGRNSSVPSRAPNSVPSATLDTSAAGIGTLHVDFVEGRVARIRVEPF